MVGLPHLEFPTRGFVMLAIIVSKFIFIPALKPRTARLGNNSDFCDKPWAKEDFSFGEEKS